MLHVTMNWIKKVPLDVGGAGCSNIDGAGWFGGRTVGCSTCSHLWPENMVSLVMLVTSCKGNDEWIPKIEYSSVKRKFSKLLFSQINILIWISFSDRIAKNGRITISLTLDQFEIKN